MPASSGPKSDPNKTSAYFWFALLLDREVRANVFLRNASMFLPDYTALYQQTVGDIRGMCRLRMEAVFNSEMLKAIIHIIMQC